MHYSKFTVLKAFIRTAKVFSLQFYYYHGILLFLRNKTHSFGMKWKIKWGGDIKSMGISSYNLLNVSQKGLKAKTKRREND